MARRLIDPDKRREQRRQERLMRVIERQHEPQIRAELSREYSKLIRDYEAGEGVKYDPEHQRNIAEILERMAGASVRVFGARILDQGKGHGIALERKDFASTLAKLAQRYIAQEAFRRHITNIAETTRAQIITGIARGEAEGLGVAGVGRYLRDLVPSLTSYRANLIARTETHGAANYGADAAARETGLTLQKEWVSAADERTREDHAAADGQTVDMDGMFNVGGEGLRYPGDPSGSGGNIINCRCGVSHIVIGE
jgi:uncharacterized protein with gpF-like domain